MMDRSGRRNSDSLEVNGTLGGATATVPTPGSPSATFDNQLPEEDVNNRTASDTKDEADAMGKQNGRDIELEDAAQERMLKDEEKCPEIVKKDTSEVKFISENGDAKIEIGEQKKTLSGMGKEELMHYARDPFWIKVRWFLFAMFWILWIGMLVSAVVIVVLAPKCPKPVPRRVWEESPIVKLKFSDSKTTEDLRGLTGLMVDLKDSFIKAIALPAVFNVSITGHVTDFKGINPQFGTREDFDVLKKTAKENNLYLILDIDPNHSSIEHPWFIAATKPNQNNRDHENFYVWRDGIELTPPNNWQQVNSKEKSAWTWNKNRRQFYLHQFDESLADLNYRNDEVINEFAAILKFWIERGIDGFRLANTSYLLEDSNFQKESFNPSSAGLNRVHTKDLPDNIDLLKKWQKAINATDDERLFGLTDSIASDIQAKYKEGNLIDLPQSSLFVINADTINARSLNESIYNNLNAAEWPSWDVSNLQVGLDKDTANSIVLMSLLLPGTPILSYNDSVQFKNVTEKRSGLAFQHGDFKTHLLNNNTVFAYTRIKENPSFVVLFNSDRLDQNVDLSTTLKNVAGNDMTVVAASHNYRNKDAITIPWNNIPMYGNSTLVLSYDINA